jgi:cell division transport system permease protein
MAMKVSWFFKEALISLKRNWVMSLAAITTVALSLLIVGVFAFTALTLDQMISSLEREVEVEAFLKDTATTQEINDLQHKIFNWSEVDKVRYISKEEALRRFRREHPELTQEIGDVNPLPASFQVQLKDPHDVEKVAKRLEKVEIVEEVEYGKKIVKKLFAATNAIRLVGTVFILLLSFVSLALITITIRLAIFARRQEVAIMRLVGASNWFIRLPFLLEGMIEGLIGALLATIIIFFLRTSFFLRIKESLKFLPIEFSSLLFFQVSFGLIVAGLTIGALGSTIALRKYLKV